MAEILELISKFGLPAVLVVYFVWENHQRRISAQIIAARLAEVERLRAEVLAAITADERKAMNARIQSIEDYQRNRLEKLAVDGSEALHETAAAVHELTRALSLRPCIAKDIAETLQGKTA